MKTIIICIICLCYGYAYAEFEQFREGDVISHKTPIALKYLSEVMPQTVKALKEGEVIEIISIEGDTMKCKVMIIKETGLNLTERIARALEKIAGE